jgi:flagellar hook assembly protein FlgD
VAWTVTVRDDTGATVASGTGTGAKLDWTWDATAAAPAHYTWAMTAPSMRSATGSIGSAAVPLALTQLKVAPTIVSPNGDGRGDQAQVTYRLTAAASVTAQLQDSTGVPLATVFQGTRPAGKQQLKWSPPASVPDGWYKLAVTATAGAKQVSTSTRFWIDRTLAATKAAPAFSPNGDGVLDTDAIGFTLVSPAHVEVRVQQGSKLVASLLTVDLPVGPQKLSWDGGGLPDGRYTVVVSTTDSLLTVTQTVPVAIDRKPPTLRLVSRRTLVFRASEPGRLVVALNGRWRVVTVRKAGLVHIAARGRVQRLTGYLVDLAGNKSRAVSARR